MVFHEDIYAIDEKNDSASEGVSESIPEKDESKDKLPLKYKGTNEHQLLILVSNSAEEFLSAKETAFLGNILKAVNYNLEDVAIVNMHSCDHSIDEITDIILPEQIISFGTEGMGGNLYTIFDQQDIKNLSADDLSAIEENIDLKKKLWQQLKILFA